MPSAKAGPSLSTTYLACLPYLAQEVEGGDTRSQRSQRTLTAGLKRPPIRHSLTYTAESEGRGLCLT